MDMTDLLYRAFRDYRKNTKDDRDCEKRRRAVARAGASDSLEIDETECEIEEDWIAAIEEGLEYIGRAIEEERQFIRSNGEVVPIEKVKSVSRESAEHLSRHGELITRRQEEGIIPDKLFTVERLNDYTVYENKFLYMLLCYLRDFISYRYGKIAEYSNTYRARLSIGKTVDTGSRQTVISLHMEDIRKNDARTREKSGVKEKLARIDSALKTVHLLLGTPLMQELSKVPVLKPPVTETNVLKMDKNFKGAMRLYYFLVSYQKDGFSVKKNTRRFAPFSEEIADGFAETEELISFLMYMHGMQIEEELRQAYTAEEERRKREELRRREEQLKSLQKRISGSGKSAGEYMLLLEEKCRSAERDLGALSEAYSRGERLLAESEERAAALELALQESSRSLDEALRTHREEKDRLEREYRDAVAGLESRQSEEIGALKEGHAEELRSLKEKHSEELAALQSERKKEREEREKAFAAETARLQEVGKNAEERFARAERQRERAESEAARMEKERTLAQARLHALKSEYGAFAPEEDFTSMERFDEIEHEYRTFQKFFKTEWRKAKKRIRKEALAKALAPDKKERGADVGDEDGKSGES